MALRLLNMFGVDKEKRDEKKVNNQSIVVGDAKGAAGTTFYTGVISDDHISKMRGHERSLEFSKMKRSNGSVAMVLRAMKTPIMSADWSFQKRTDIDNLTVSDEEFEKQEKLAVYVFNNMNTNFKKLIREMLTAIEQGFSIHEITHKIIPNAPELGKIVGFKDIAFRKQSTIWEWKVDFNGNLMFVNQQVDGDTNRNVDMDARFLMHFAPDMEGDNFEGESILRPAYGAYIRGNKYRKLQASGIEKNANGTPVLTIPMGAEISKETEKAKSALMKLVQSISNYMIKPAGYEFEIVKGAHSVEEVRKEIDAEDKEVILSALAGFLILGQSSGGSGSYSLGTDLSDFFLGSLEYIANAICDQINDQFDYILKVNYGIDTLRVIELVAAGVRDKAGKEFAEVVALLKDKDIVRADDRLDGFMREKYKLPAPDESTVRESAAPQPFNQAPNDDIE